MRRGRAAALLSVLMLTVACSGSGSDDASSSTVVTSPPVVSESVDTEPSTTVAPTTTTTVVDTTAPPTTVSDAELEQQLKAEVEAAYLAAYDAYHAALLDPTDESLRARLPDVLTGDALENTIRILDDLAADDIFAIENPDLPAFAEITSDIRFVDEERTNATFSVCEINSELFFQDGEGPNGEPVLLRETIIRVDGGIRVLLVDGTWKQASGGNSREFPGVESCDEL